MTKFKRIVFNLYGQGNPDDLKTRRCFRTDLITSVYERVSSKTNELCVFIETNEDVYRVKETFDEVINKLQNTEWLS